MSAQIISFAEKRDAIRARQAVQFNAYGLLLPAGLVIGIAFWVYVGVAMVKAFER